MYPTFNVSPVEYGSSSRTVRSEILPYLEANKLAYHSLTDGWQKTEDSWIDLRAGVPYVQLESPASLGKSPYCLTMVKYYRWGVVFALAGLHLCLFLLSVLSLIVEILFIQFPYLSQRKLFQGYL